jgi:hypothetical protein
MARLRTPGWTTAVREYLSILRIWLNFAVESTTPSAMGMAPPDRPVPAPRGTICTCSAWQAFMMAMTCASFSGSTTTMGNWR